MKSGWGNLFLIFRAFFFIFHNTHWHFNCIRLNYRFTATYRVLNYILHHCIRLLLRNAKKTKFHHFYTFLRNCSKYRWPYLKILHGDPSISFLKKYANMIICSILKNHKVMNILSCKKNDIINAMPLFCTLWFPSKNISI